MKHYPCVLTIAGSDCSGGAGIQADIKTISALGAYAASAITAITVQNTCGVTGIHPVPASYVKGQIEAVMTDIRPRAIKIGMINDVNIVKVIAESLQTYKPEFVVFDPVMVSTSGCKLMEDEAIEAITSQLMPLSTLITPNLREAEVLTGMPIPDIETMKTASRDLLHYGCHAVLVKGGHLENGGMCDVLQIENEAEPHLFTADKVESFILFRFLFHRKNLKTSWVKRTNHPSNHCSFSARRKPLKHNNNRNPHTPALPLQFSHTNF